MKALGNISMLLVALFVMMLVVTGMSSFLVDMANHYEYNITYYTDPNGVVKNLDTFKDINRTLTSQVINTSNSAGEMAKYTLPYSDFLVSAFRSLTLATQSLNIFTNIISDTQTILGIPSEIGDLILMIVTVIIIFTIISAALKWRI